jgi:hypothetical protein
MRMCATFKTSDCTAAFIYSNGISMVMNLLGCLLSPFISLQIALSEQYAFG